MRKRRKLDGGCKTVYKDLFSMDGEVAIITGGASGIGKEIAKGLYEYGANIIIADINEDNISRTLKDIDDNFPVENGKCLGYKCDVSDSKQVKGLRDFAVNNLKKIDVLVISHGIARRNWALDMTEREFDEVIEVNLKGVYLCVSEIGKLMVEQNKGSIISISSIASLVGMTRNVNYSAAKGGVNSLTRAFGVEWAKYGVRVNAIAPGPCETEFTKVIYSDPTIYKGFIDKLPIGRVATPDEMVGVALLLASKAGSNITGQVIIVDGGYTMQ